MSLVSYSGYGCNDHFLENDTYLHTWQMIVELLANDLTAGIICDIGAPIMHKGVRYNCRVLILNGQILLIRPKMFLANSGNYRESRWFTAWNKVRFVEEHFLPSLVTRVNGQQTVPFGDALISSKDTCIGFEICEELFVPDNPSVHMALDGVEIVANGSGSHHELGKLQHRIRLIENLTHRLGLAYLYSNQRGCDGERLYYDGSSMIALNGQVIALASQFSLSDIELAMAVFDLEDIRLARAKTQSIGHQSSMAPTYPRIKVDFRMTEKMLYESPTNPLSLVFPSKELEIS